MASAIIIGNGRMGALVARTLEATGRFEVAGVYDVDTIDALADAAAADVAIDFSHLSAIPQVAAYVARTGTALVSGTTGLGEEELALLRAAGEHAPVVWSPNYALGVAVLRRLAAQAAAALADFDIEIVETHHNKKADAPSGTAKALLAAVDPAGSCDVVYGREGMVGARTAREIGVHAVRGGTVAGTHEVHLFGPDEEVCLTHRATSRQIFASGAVAAAERLMACAPGFYTFDQLMFGD